MDVRLVTRDGARRCPPDQLSSALTLEDGFVWVDLPVGDPDTKRVEIDFDPGRVTLAQIEAALDEAGYPIQK